MTIEKSEGPSSPAAKQALEELQKEGHVMSEDDNEQEFNEDGTLKDTTATEEKIPEETPEAKLAKENADKKAIEDANVAKGLNPDGSKKEDGKKTEREVTHVPAYKLKIAEDQKEKAQKELADAKSEIERLSKLSGDLSKKDEKDLNEVIKTLAEKHNVDPAFLTDIKELIASQQTLPADIAEKLKKIDELDQFKNTKTEEAKVQERDTTYAREFDSEVLPMLKAENPKLPDDVILKIKKDLKVLAFSEGYNVLSLKKVFLAEKESFKLPTVVVPKKTTEDAKSGVVRADNEIDFDNMSEEKFKQLSDEDTKKFLDYQKKKGGSGWKK